MSHYETLGVAKDATLEQIQTAYRSLARKYHPDMHKDEVKKQEVSKLFKEVTEAFEILNDPAKRSQYDQLGYVGRRPPTPPPPPKPPKQTKTKEDFEAERAKQDKHQQGKFSRDELDAVQCTYFGGERTGRNILVHLKLTPEEYRFGCTKAVDVKRRDMCWRCAGDRFLNVKCKACRSIPQFSFHCTYCRGEGYVDEKCALCDGTGFGYYVIDTIKVTIPPNSQQGHSITVPGGGEISIKAQLPGCLRVILI